ncbi:TetR/AcrR family transcriptional regulator [Thiothrix lacustris]|uniref:TetR/AcrR family transcriptional regulator n=1 Tax=Thiothrix lacustris TaxID=525917 RepID=UPI0027E5661C|nr:TetR/AcrR family transcriptional regulator [Thiothrix lacustris]WMP18857.1 TetR/AcrR family transcriptional regulator [Thiothrix lacustris]
MLIHVESHKQDKSVGRIRQQNESKIIAAAEIEFARHGYKGASIQNIAERSGLPKANIHYYFRSKQGLYAAVLSNILNLWDEVLSELDPEGDPAQELEAYIRAKMALSRDYPLASRIFGIEIMHGGPHLKEYFQDGYVDWFKGRTAVFETWIAQGKMNPVDPAHLVFLLWSSTQHYADFSCQIDAALGKQQAMLDATEFDKAADTLLHIILQGCGIRQP